MHFIESNKLPFTKLLSSHLVRYKHRKNSGKKKALNKKKPLYLNYNGLKSIKDGNKIVVIHLMSVIKVKTSRKF